MREVEPLAADGVKEVTLLGPERELLRARPAEGGAHRLRRRCSRSSTRSTGIERIRYTSPHPKDVRERLVAAHAELPSLCEHIHLPLQSGSSRILKAMRRTYDRDRYMKRVEMIRASVPDCAITTDIIVGFPGETEDDFRETLEVVDEVGYDSAFTFVFSPRREHRGGDAARPGSAPGQARAHGAARRARPAPRAGAQRALRRHRRRRCWSRARAAPTPRGCAGARATTRRSTSRASRSPASWRRSRSPARRRRRSPARSRSSRALPDVVALFGPTGVGKTEVAVELAGAAARARRRPVAVSADAIAVYEGLDVLAAKPSPTELERLEHRLISCVPIDEEFSAGRVRGAGARRDRRAAGGRARTPIVVGGTGLYLRAALTELDLQPAAGARPARAARARAGRGRARRRCTGGCRPTRPQAVHPNDRKRIVRALELELMGEQPHARSDAAVVGASCAARPRCSASRWSATR